MNKTKEKVREWTEELDENQEYTNYVYYMACDFVDRAEQAMKEKKVTKSQLAKLMNISQARVSQILNDPGNFTLESIVRCARALKMKVTLLTYEDGDPENSSGPIIPDVFIACWENCGKPRDLFDIKERQPAP